MRKIQGLLANALIVILLLLLTGVLIITLNKKTSGMDATSQAVPAQASQQESPIATSTPSLSKTTEPDFLEPVEPTWTPVIIMPKGTPSPVPTPLPTPTVTPVNPREELLLELKSLTGQLAISPNDQEIVFNQLSLDGSQNELWKLHLTDKKLTKLSEFGGIPEWSPDNHKIIVLRTYWDASNTTEAKAEIRVITSDGKNEKSLIKKNWSEVLGYYYTKLDKIKLVSPDGIESIDQTGKVTKEVNLTLLTKIQKGSPPPKVDGSSEHFVIVNENSTLQVIQHTGNRVTIVNPKGRSISDFSLSYNKKNIAYIAIDGPIEELWITDLNGKEQQRLYGLPDGGTITAPRWSPNGKTIAIGHRPTGTYYGETYDLTLIDVKTGQVTDLNVDQVGSNFIWSNDGKWLYYTRAILIESPETYHVALYRLSVER